MLNFNNQPDLILLNWFQHGKDISTSMKCKTYDLEAYYKKLIPILFFLLFGYIDFVVCYSLGYEEIYIYHSRGVAISLWVLFGVTELCIFVYWISIIIIGPGRAPRIEPFDLFGTSEKSSTTGGVPDFFFCDKEGFPFWCTECQSLKAPRTTHLRDMKYCVLRFDHYCVWVGTVIGRNNYRPFLKFVLYVDCLFLMALIFLARYTRLNYDRGTKDINHNYIVLYIVSFFGLLFVMILTVSNVRYVMHNFTTIDDLNVIQKRRYSRWKRRKDRPRCFDRSPRKESGLRYINMQYKDTRAVVEYSIHDLPFSFGFRKNFINIWLYGSRRKDQHTGGPDYSFTELFLSCILAVIPFCDLIIFLKDRFVKTKKETGQGNSSPDQLYHMNCEYISDAFLESARRKIDENKYTIPKYFGP